MKNKLTIAGRKLAWQQNILAISLVLLCSLISYFIWGFDYTQSILAAGVVTIIPNMVFALKAFKYAGAKSSKLVVESFFSGVKLKMVLTALLFVLAFKFLVLLPIPFFSMFCLIMVLPLVTPLYIKQ
ncbi:MAG: F0F1 ATP synthase assembly protein I [Gammaproteobacteria bacterium]|jgi:ATP synthase protein I|nr:MAG: F0F1 ATP synthase assembly protein I [Gammaproteobacteria bacterium]PCI52320.1 MAG: F0F1 ATP synthase assembly protein I [Gammaproteobacteria bacterium]